MIYRHHHGRNWRFASYVPHVHLHNVVIQLIHETRVVAGERFREIKSLLTLCNCRLLQIGMKKHTQTCPLRRHFKWANQCLSLFSPSGVEMNKNVSLLTRCISPNSSSLSSVSHGPATVDLRTVWLADFPMNKLRSRCKCRHGGLNMWTITTSCSAALLFLTRWRHFPLELNLTFVFLHFAPLVSGSLLIFGLPKILPTECALTRGTYYFTNQTLKFALYLQVFDFQNWVSVLLASDKVSHEVVSMASEPSISRRMFPFWALRG